MIRILNFIPNLNMNGHAMCKFCLSAVKDYSRHEITNCGMNDINNYDLDNYDIIHVHQVPQPQFFETDAKIIYDLHNFSLSCPVGNNICQIVNKYLENPLICTNCLGNIGTFTGFRNMESIIRITKRADILAVHSDFMKEYYHTWNPIMLPLLLQTDLLMPCFDKEDYILYTGRLSFDKNPWGFVKIVEKSGYKGKMILYTLSEDIAGTERHYSDLIEYIKNHKNIELILNPSLQDMIEFVKHARFTVLPYMFIEPYGLAAANSVLCGTPLVVFPYGNLRNFTNLLPRTLDEMIKTIKMDDKEYTYNLEETLKKGNKLRQIHNPENAIKIWDEVYNKL